MRDSQSEKPTPEEIEAARQRWDKHAAANKKSGAGPSGTVVVVVLVILAIGWTFIAPGDPAGYEAKVQQVKDRKKTFSETLSQIPCRVPASSAFGKWIRSNGKTCN